MLRVRLSACLLVLLAFAAVGGAAASEEDTTMLDVQITAKPLENGRIEFGIEYLGERILPEARFLTPELIQQRVGEWLTSTAVRIVGVPTAPPALAGASGAESPLYRDIDGAWDLPGFGVPSEEVYVVVQPLADGRIEFAVVHQGQRILPDVRYLSPRLIEERQGDWLRSSTVSIIAPVTPARIIRSYSDDVTWSTGGDVAELCILTRVTFAANWGAFGGGRPTQPEEIADLEDLVSDNDHYYDQEAVWLFSDERHLISSRPRPSQASRYGFIVRDLQWRAPTVYWVAEVSCGEGENEGTGEVAGGSDNANPG